LSAACSSAAPGPLLSGVHQFGVRWNAVLSALDARGGEIADALRGRPAGESDWATLRRAVDVVIGPYSRDPAHSLALTRLIQATRP